MRSAGLELWIPPHRHRPGVPERVKRGKALKDSEVDRNEVFITTKFCPGAKDSVAKAERSLRRLGVDQVDLYLVHWPQDGPTWAWPGMERARELGYARSIGISNFSGAGYRDI